MDELRKECVSITPRALLPRQSTINLDPLFQHSSCPTIIFTAEFEPPWRSWCLYGSLNCWPRWRNRLQAVASQMQMICLADSSFSGQISEIWLPVNNILKLRYFTRQFPDRCLFIHRVIFLLMKIGAFCDVTQCGSCKNRRFGGT
jgi:hypothetical protein